MPGIIPSIAFSEPIFLMADICCRKSSKVKSSSARNLRAISCGLAAVERLLGLLDEREDVAHVEDPRGHPVGVEDLEVLRRSRRSTANMIGRPVTVATDSAAPPRASPSSLDRTTPVKSTPSWNACAVSTAAWPIIASMTKRTSSGLDRRADVGGLLHQVRVDRRGGRRCRR